MTNTLWRVMNDRESEVMAGGNILNQPVSYPIFTVRGTADLVKKEDLAVLQGFAVRTSGINRIFPDARIDLYTRSSRLIPDKSDL